MAPQVSPFHTGILIIAHAPLASALRACALHVFPEHARHIIAYDIVPEISPENALPHGLELTRYLLLTNQLLILTDIIGATPFNVGKKIMDTIANSGPHPKAVQMVCGVNVPMLMRALTYRSEPLNKLTELAVSGAVNGIIHIPPTIEDN